MSEALIQNIDALEVCVDCDAECAAYLSELIWTLPGVQAIEEVYRNTEADQIQAEDLTGLKVFLMPETSETALCGLKGLLTAFPQACISQQKSIGRADWSEHWKQHWHPTPITPSLTICPSWEAYSPRGDEIVLRLDPGNAFGTGTHPTTCLMLQAMETFAKSHDFSQMSVLDVGTGSGILAIYAAKLGSQSIVGIDHDTEAVKTAIENAQLNQVEWIQFSDSPLEERCLTPFDLILANIIAPVILELLPEMLCRLSKDGVFLLSGLIATSVDDVQKALESAGFVDIEKLQLGDWYLLKAQR